MTMRFLTAMLAVLCIATVVFAHPDHVSLAEAHFNHAANSFEISMRLDAMHLEESLSAKQGSRVSLERTEDIAAILRGYVEERFAIRDATRDRWRLTWIGHEIVDLDIWIYFEMTSPGLPDGSPLEVRHSVMLEWMPRQINTITFRVDEERKSLRFSRESRLWQSVELPLAAKTEQQVQWVRDNAVDVSEERGLAGITAAIAPRRVVLLGPTGDDARIVGVRDRLTRFLITKGGFAAVAVEMDPLAAMQSDDGLLEEFRQAGVVVTGYDVPTIGSDLGARLRAFISPVVPEAAELLPLDLLDKRVVGLGAKDVQRLESLVLELGELSTTHLPELARHHGDAAADAFSQTVADLPLGLTCAMAGPEGGIAARTAENQRSFARAGNIERIAGLHSSGVVVVSSAARVDRSTSEDGGVRTSMGNWLHQLAECGGMVRAYTIVFTTTQRNGQLERLLDDAAIPPAAFLDLSRLDDGHWMHAPRTGSPIGLPQGTASVWAAIVDGVIRVTDHHE